MARNLILIITLMISGAFSGCKKEQTGPDLNPKVIELSAGASEVISSSNQFGIELFTRTATGESGNLMLSPLSASAALTMALNGAGGQTFDQIRQMLGYPSNMSIAEINRAYRSLVSQLLVADPKVKLTLANAMFYRLGFPVKPPFTNSMLTDFAAHVEGLNFDLPAAVNTINNWASEKTNGRIPKVIDQINAETVMFLMNALYFKGDWTYQFNAAETRNRTFYLDGGGIINVPTMSESLNVKTFSGSNFRAIELPYGRKNFSMVVIVPNETLSKFYPTFTPEIWGTITAGLDARINPVRTVVTLPKFEFKFEKTLNDQLKSMGMTDAFVPRVANFTNMTDWEVFVSFVKQNSFVKVDETGTEAAAVTTIGIGVVSMPPSFDANKPFIFAIRERTTNTLLFIGSVANPLL